MTMFETVLLFTLSIVNIITIAKIDVVTKHLSEHIELFAKYEIQKSTLLNRLTIKLDTLLYIIETKELQDNKLIKK